MALLLRRACFVLLLVLVITTPGFAQTGGEAVRKVLDDYIGLYRADTLERWRTLFLPGFVAAFTNDDGSVTTRTLDEFYERQRKFFATGRPIREELQNVRIVRQGHIANVTADFVLFDGESKRPGRLMLLFIEERGVFKIHSLIFTSHLT